MVHCVLNRWKRHIEAFREIKKLADQYGAEYCFGFATSAVREAANGLEFMEHISEYCPMEWRILSGDEEAIYGFNGALRGTVE